MSGLYGLTMRWFTDQHRLRDGDAYQLRAYHEQVRDDPPVLASIRRFAREELARELDVPFAETSLVEVAAPELGEYAEALRHRVFPLFEEDLRVPEHLVVLIAYWVSPRGALTPACC
jgi:hypothetical protein